MVFVFAEDDTLDVVASWEEAQHYEPIDVESGVFQFYDADGCYLEPLFTEPSRQWKLFGLVIRATEPGAYQLRRREIPQGEDSIEIALCEVAALNSNPWFDSLEKVIAHLHAQRRAIPNGETLNNSDL